jgi:Ribbon-helix-helix protein, copG family
MGLPECQERLLLPVGLSEPSRPPIAPSRLSARRSRPLRPAGLMTWVNRLKCVRERAAITWAPTAGAGASCGHRTPTSSATRGRPTGPILLNRKKQCRSEGAERRKDKSAKADEDPCQSPLVCATMQTLLDAGSDCMSKSITLAARVDADLDAELSQLAAKTGRTKSWLITRRFDPSSPVNSSFLLPWRKASGPSGKGASWIIRRLLPPLTDLLPQTRDPAEMDRTSRDQIRLHEHEAEEIKIAAIRAADGQRPYASCEKE